LDRRFPQASTVPTLDPFCHGAGLPDPLEGAIMLPPAYQLPTPTMPTGPVPSQSALQDLQDPLSGATQMLPTQMLPHPESQVQLGRSPDSEETALFRGTVSCLPPDPLLGATVVLPSSVHPGLAPSPSPEFESSLQKPKFSPRKKAWKKCSRFRITCDDPQFGAIVDDFVEREGKPNEYIGKEKGGLIRTEDDMWILKYRGTVVAVAPKGPNTIAPPISGWTHQEAPAPFKITPHLV